MPECSNGYPCLGAGSPSAAASATVRQSWPGCHYRCDSRFMMRGPGVWAVAARAGRWRTAR
jgi:hypothetical protein